MKTVNYKTNINCGGCLKSVTPFLNQLDNVDTWKVHLDCSNKILEVVLEDDNDAVVVKAVKEAGFEIEAIQI